MTKIIDPKRENIKACLMSIHQIGADYVHKKLDDFVMVAMLQSEVEHLKRLVKK